MKQISASSQKLVDVELFLIQRCILRCIWLGLILGIGMGCEISIISEVYAHTHQCILLNITEKKNILFNLSSLLVVFFSCCFMRDKNIWYWPVEIVPWVFVQYVSYIQLGGGRNFPLLLYSFCLRYWVVWMKIIYIGLIVYYSSIYHLETCKQNFLMVEMWGCSKLIFPKYVHANRRPLSV